LIPFPDVFQSFELPMPVYESYIPYSVGEGTMPVASALELPSPDFFSQLPADKAASRSIVPPDTKFDLTSGVTVLVKKASVRPSIFQCLLMALNGKASPCRKFGPPQSVLIDEAAGLSVSGMLSEMEASDIRKLWQRMISGEVEPSDSTTLPKLYGGKSRLTGFINAAVLAYLPEGSPLLDLMSGTGVVSRTLGRYFNMSANDANPYAALITKAQTTDFEGDVDNLLSRLRLLAAENETRLRALIPEMVSLEAAFLHGEITEQQRVLYKEFCEATPSYELDGLADRLEPYRLCVQLYANIYFGVSQCIDLDSVRAAIDRGTAEGSPERTLTMAALLTAASTCNSGPHFAQPVKIPSLRAFKIIVERRARNVAWEFELALRRLAARRRLAEEVPVTQLDWRLGLNAFLGANSETPKGVYVDPPYSKLQYSRYYHVLNVLITYDYPEIRGVGRYPPMEQRFSSRFENQPTTALKEFRELFDRCSSAGLVTFLSYSDTGFVPIGLLVAEMKSRYSSVDILSEQIRHHSQGVRTAKRGMVTEYILVGRP
jgi:adenine-specific DNA-methyltransferase